MKRLILQIIAVMLTVSAFARDTADLVTDKRAQEVLNEKCIRLGTSELLPIEFKIACATLSRPDIIQAAQLEFVRSISKNGKVDYPIIQDAPGQFHYVDESEKRTDIRELYRKQTDAFSFDYIMHAHGKRFFGKYDVVIHLQVIDAGEAGILYSVKTHAYPHRWLTRFSATKISTVKRYFKKKMRVISWVAREVGLHLCEEEELRQQIIGEASPSGTGPSKP